jgi:N-acetylmuramoyl-L-alanine amidase
VKRPGNETRSMQNFRRIGPIAIVAALMAWGAGAPAQSGAASKKAQPSPPTCNRTDFRLVVDVGHTAEAPGATSSRGAKEYDFNLRLGTLIHRSLIDAGFKKTILLVTDGKARPSLAKRVNAANRSSADLFLSIHHDSVPTKFLEKWEFEGQELVYSDRFKGHSIFVSQQNAQAEASVLFGKLLGQQLKARGLIYTPHYTEKFMGKRQRILVEAEAGVYRFDHLVVLMKTNMPAVLLEAGSIINRDEELRMNTAEHKAVISAAVVDAVDEFCAKRQIRKPLPGAKRSATAPRKKPAPAH